MRSARLRLLFVCFLATAAVARAEDYYLPQVANGNYGVGSFRTTFVFFNNNDTAVSVILELTNDQGSPLSLTIPGLGTDSQFVISLPAGASRIVQTDGSGNLVAGAAHVTSTAAIGVSAIFTVLTPGGSFQTEAGVGGSEGLTDFVIPVDVTGAFNTGFALYDIGGGGATATATLINSSGGEVGHQSITLAGNGHTAQFVTQLFPGTSNFRGSLRVTSPTPIAAVGLRQNDTPLSYTSLPAVSHSSSQTTFSLAQVANGSFGEGSFKTTFVLFNISGSTANVSLSLTRDNGTPFPVTIPGQGTNSTFSLQLASGGSAFLQTDGTGSLAAGAASITSNVPLGAAAIFTVVDSHGAFQTEAGVGDSPAKTTLTLPVDVTGAFDTGIAFFVPGSSAVTLNMKLLSTSGAVVSTAQPLSLPAKNHTAMFVTQLFPGTSNFQGSVAITATGGVSALTLRQHTGPLSYTTLPVAAGAASGTTPPQESKLLSQTRTDVGATSDSTLNVSLPAGFKIYGNISGTPIPQTITAKSGSTAYSGLIDAITHNYVVVVPAGTYNLTVCCTQVGEALLSIQSAYADPNAVQVSGDTQHNITLPSLTLFGVSGTVSGLPTVSGTSQAYVVFTSTDFKSGGTFSAAGGVYSGQLPNGNYVATAEITSFGATGFQATGIYNIGAVTISGAPAIANLTAPATAHLTGTVRIAGTPATAQGSFLFASDQTVGTPQGALCVFPSGGASTTLDPAGAYDVRIVTNRSHGVGVSIPVYKGSTTSVAGAAMYPSTIREITIGADTVSNFDLPAFPAQVRITGTVTDGSGKGVKDVSVGAYSKEISSASGLAFSGAATTDASGNYELVLLSGTNYQIQFVPPLPKP